MFVKKEIYIFNVKCGNVCIAELNSKKPLAMPAAFIERKLSVGKKGNK